MRSYKAYFGAIFSNNTAVIFSMSANVLQDIIIALFRETNLKKLVHLSFKDKLQTTYTTSDMTMIHTKT